MRKFQFFVNCQHKKKEMKPVVIHEPWAIFLKDLITSNKHKFHLSFEKNV
jgi:hypothetical protein